ncbi:protocatechuate 3,4-dioxygenase subunit alpha [Arsenicicoccus sp. oral taxon 190]|uniref:protocatechuate 3,4-dioxygenase subunit alpha n=1 Tax=Arsenicicoccus sp. oral taxon 190 TaxID=1658671 RepID=UPI00067A2EE4|nr:protocatechuate 3,4-dioxygenase subunit alpha [Arsenicicoccus sp. oral taxon 190]AKT50980.1 protocatechuate 3,4-dioxygenase [Arsenicicoccus sp. oral taxon 190]
MTRLVPTPGQTVGPFYGFALPVEHGHEIVAPSHPRAVRLHGTVYDGQGTPIPDALLELWQADEQGRISQEHGSLTRDGWTFTGFARVAVDNVGRYSVTTVEPGPTTPGRPPFIAVTVFARGLLNRLLTRAYLPDSEGLQDDPLLASLSEAERETLVCRREEDGSLRFDIRLQGEGETVFLAFDDGFTAGPGGSGGPAS